MARLDAVSTATFNDLPKVDFSDDFDIGDWPDELSRFLEDKPTATTPATAQTKNTHDVAGYTQNTWQFERCDSSEMPLGIPGFFVFIGVVTRLMSDNQFLNMFLEAGTMFEAYRRSASDNPVAFVNTLSDKVKVLVKETQVVVCLNLFNVIGDSQHNWFAFTPENVFGVSKFFVNTMYSLSKTFRNVFKLPATFVYPREHLSNGSFLVNNPAPLTPSRESVCKHGALFDRMFSYKPQPRCLVRLFGDNRNNAHAPNVSAVNTTGVLVLVVAMPSSSLARPKGEYARQSKNDKTFNHANHIEFKKPAKTHPIKKIPLEVYPEDLLCYTESGKVPSPRTVVFMVKLWVSQAKAEGGKLLATTWNRAVLAVQTHRKLRPSHVDVDTATRILHDVHDIENMFAHKSDFGAIELIFQTLCVAWTAVKILLEECPIIFQFMIRSFCRATALRAKWVFFAKAVHKQRHVEPWTPGQFTLHTTVWPVGKDHGYHKINDMVIRHVKPRLGVAKKREISLRIHCVPYFIRSEKPGVVHLEGEFKL